MLFEGCLLLFPLNGCQLEDRQTAAGRVVRAVGIVAVEIVVAVVVVAVGAKAVFARQATARGRALAVRIEAVDGGVAVVTLIVGALLAAGRWNTAAARRHQARGIETIGHPVAVVVGSIGAHLNMTGKHVRVQIVAVDPAAQLVDEAVVVIILQLEIAAAGHAAIGGAEVEIVALEVGGADIGDTATALAARSHATLTTRPDAALSTWTLPSGPLSTSAVAALAGRPRLERGASARGRHPEQQQAEEDGGYFCIGGVSGNLGVLQVC